MINTARGYIAKWLMTLVFKIAPARRMYFADFRPTNLVKDGTDLMIVGNRKRYGTVRVLPKGVKRG